MPAAIITSSTHAADLLTREFGINSDKVFPVLDSVNTDTFRPRCATDEADLFALQEQLGIPHERTIVVYLGLLAEHQGTSLLLHAARELLNERPELHFLVMGFPNEQHYAQLAGDLGILQHTTFTGRLPYEQAARHLRLADIAVAPKMSTTEGCGKLLNYMAVGLPTIAFRTPISDEYLGAGGSYAEQMDAPSFAAAIRALLDREADWPDISQMLRERAQTRFSWEAAGRQISEIYDLIAD
jgi:glycosyltransferase involved in cell wall biosynthesis